MFQRCPQSFYSQPSGQQSRQAAAAAQLQQLHLLLSGLQPPLSSRQVQLHLPRLLLCLCFGGLRLCHRSLQVGTASLLGGQRLLSLLKLLPQGHHQGGVQLVECRCGGALSNGLGGQSSGVSSGCR